jgi:hypothetical protein
MNEEPDDDLIREVYARFGLAYYESECLHRSLCIALAWSTLPPPDLTTQPRVEERLAKAFSLTLGEVVDRLQNLLPEQFLTSLPLAVERRNFLAHRFWFERAHLMFSEEGGRRLIAELQEYCDAFDRLDKQTGVWLTLKRGELGFTDEMLHASLEEVLAGQDKPLPDKETVREIDKKLTRRQRLTRVWEFSLNDGRRPLVFELADGSLWQLCDVGLGWTHYQTVRADWVEHPGIKPYLPADILPRPEAQNTWDYEFPLAKGAVLGVKPGRQKYTFRWGIRTQAASAEQSAPPDGDSLRSIPAGEL